MDGEEKLAYEGKESKVMEENNVKTTDDTDKTDVTLAKNKNRILRK